MPSTGWKREWTETAVVAAVSLFLYQMNMLMLFCIPLQVLYTRRSERELLLAIAGVAVGVLIVSTVRTWPVAEVSLRRTLIFLDVIIPAAFMAALYVVDSGWGRLPRRLYRLLAATALVGLASVPVILVLSRNDRLNDVLRAQIELVMRMFAGGEAGAPAEDSGVGFLGDPERVAALLKDVLLRNYMFIFFLLLSGSVWYGTSFGRRASNVPSYRLSRFQVPEQFIWFLLVPWAGVLLDMLVGIGVLSFVAWNAGLTMLFVYGMQGVGIAQHFLDRRSVGLGLRFMLTAVGALLLFWPGVNLLVIVGFPALGVSEHWINYRTAKE